MKQKIIEFFRNKFNIALIVLQVFGIVCYFLSKYIFFMIFFFLCEGAFFIVWGIKLIINNRNSEYGLEIYDQLPYTESQREQIKKSTSLSSKNNKIMAIMLILLGIILLGSIISIIF